MHSWLLLSAIACVIAAPGIAATLLLYRPGEIGVVTFAAAIFGLGFAVAGGCAFVLAVAHILWLTTYLPLWLALTVGLGVMALRGVSIGAHVRAISAELAGNRIPLLVGGAILLVLLIVRASYLHNLPGPHYVYFLNGMEIANSHAIPDKVLEYGQGWPPATDKVFLDAFTAVVALIDNNPLVGPGVLLWISYAGAAIGLWAFASELGLRRLGILLPVLMLANSRIMGKLTSQWFSSYRGEDFGMAVAFCALALGVSAIRHGGRNRAVAAGIVLAAASGAHLVPTVVAVVILGSVYLAELVRRGRPRDRRTVSRYTLMFGATAAALGLVIRVVAGGSFGLGGASNQASYKSLPTSFDPTLFLYNGIELPRNRPEAAHFYVAPGDVLERVMSTALSSPLSLATAILVLILALIVGIGFTVVRNELGTVGLAGLGVIVGVTLIALGFSYRYHVWVDATFGLRRPTLYVAIGPILLTLGLVETLIQLAGRRDWGWPHAGRAVTAAPVVIAIIVVVLLVPTATRGPVNVYRSTGQQAFATWVRTSTPCGARFLLNQRSEGSVAALTGRLAIDEGMGAFLRPHRLARVIRVLRDANGFFRHPKRNNAVLARYHINYVVYANLWLLGYPGPVYKSNDAELRGDPYLRLAVRTQWFSIYHVKGSTVQPVSPLLKGKYLGCRTTPAQF